ncbi:MAG TPA: hypothetical protein VMM57_06325 [Bacteroidota bacterium]|nr:hypothetical protein [Bacteroidota bacterium]
MMRSGQSGEKAADELFYPALFLFLAGFLLHCFLAARSWVGGDQIYLLNLGLDFANHGNLHPLGKWRMGAGTNPGVLLQLLIGIPLALWHNFHAPMVAVLLSHLVSGILVAGMFRSVLGSPGLFFATVAYWLSPWRLYNGGILWEPAFIFLPAAAHLWACHRLRDRASFWPSAVLFLSLFSAVQIHNSSFILFLVTAFLAGKRKIRIHWAGAGAGMATAGVTLIPAVITLLRGNLPPSIHSEGFLGAGFVMVYPTLKGILYWFTLGALDVVRQLEESVFRHSEGVVGVRMLQGLSVASVGLSILASWRLVRHSGRQGDGEDELGWLKSYAISTFAALVLSAALSPVVLQGWMVVVALPGACIPVVLYASKLWRSQPRRTSWAVAAYVTFEITLALVMGLGDPIFRRTESLPPNVDPHGELAPIIPHQSIGAPL